MSFPGKHAGTKYSFGEVKGDAKEHEVTNPPMKGHSGKYSCTIEQYANIEHGEKLGERPGRIHHVSHEK